MNSLELVKKVLALFVLMQCCMARVFAVVPSDVNSGDPAFPFPQFLDYGPDRKSLASHNAPGVTHAEMEKRILDAWQHICNNTKQQGYAVDGVQYLIPDATAAETHCGCAEGDGYYLLPAAIMGDKTYFDGYYMSMHDRMFIGVKRFYDGGTNVYDGYSKNLNGAGSFGSGSAMTIGNYSGGDGSATDGDVDIALALLIAAKQWGENSGIMTSDGELNYKEEALKYIRAMVDTVLYTGSLPVITYVSGVVGFDGYLKSGSHQSQLTNWSVNGGNSYKGLVTQHGGGQGLYFDYSAPAYFNEYRKFLELDAKSTDWQIDQCRRCEASSDWLMGQLYNRSETSIPICGDVQMNGSDQSFSFGSSQFSEDFRAGWRTILNYVWHGNPEYTWDPASHETVAGSNSYEKDMGLRYGKFLANPQAAPWNNECNAIGDMGLKFFGPYTLRNVMDIDGNIGAGFPLNWIHGAGAPAAIASQDFELMGQMFRHCVIAWDDDNFTTYEESTPHYFHEWFKLLGMLVLSGNFQAPSAMVPNANLKVYHKVDKTYAFAGDEVKFTVTVRNYGSVDSKNAVVKFGIPEGFSVVKTTQGSLSGDSIVWNLGTLSGVHSATGVTPTIDSMVVTCRLNDDIAQGRYCTSARVYCDNGFGWTSDEYPNNITDVMERNCVDVVARALKIEKTVNRTQINPDNIAQFTINFENSAEAGWINGGRPGVRLSYGHLAVDDPANASGLVSFYRLFHDADEAYINYGNYRVSYYMYDPSLTCFSGDGDCGIGWSMSADYYQGGLKDALVISHETTVEGSDEYGKWNQRIIVQFADQLAGPTQHLQQYASASVADGSHVHEGGGSTLLLNTRMSASNYKNFDLTDDWSYDARWTSAEQNDLHFPVVDDYTDPDDLGKEITSWDRHSCGTPDDYVDRILVEEWDGYTWRRILGNGPMPGRDVYNVVVRDTLPKGLKFEEFVNSCPLEEYGASWRTFQTSEGLDVVEWTIDRMMIKQKGSIVYNATVTFPSGNDCETPDEIVENKAYIWGDKESAIWDTAHITVTCAKVPDPIIPTTLTKTADKEIYSVGDDISYTVEYEQTHGAIFENAESKASDWTLSGFTISGGSLTTASNTSGNAQYNYSKGSNYYVTMDLDPATYATFQIVLRQGAASPISLQIKPDVSQNILFITTYEGSTVKQSEQEVIYKGSSSPIALIVDLTDDLLRLWVNKDTTSGPVYSVSGLSSGVGYVGFKNGNISGGDSYGVHKFSNIYVHTDYAYNLSIIDRKPDEISFVSADNEGKLLGDSIVWTFEQGIDNPIPWGTKYTVSWSGTVDACSESIINIAYVKLLGHDDNEIMAQAVSGCGESDECPLTSVHLAVDDAEICKGDSTVLRATATPTGDYYYEFYHKQDLNTPIAPVSTVDTIVVKEGGNYTVKVYCKKGDDFFLQSSDDGTVVMHEPDDVTALGDLGLGTNCYGKANVTPLQTLIAFTQLMGKSTFDFVDFDGSIVHSLPKINSVREPGDYEIPLVMVSSKGCVSDTAYVTFTVADTAVVDLGPDVTICAGETATFDAGEGSGYTYKWSDGSTLQTLSVSEAGTYSVVVSTADGCETSASASVIVSDKLLVDLGSDTTVCASSVPYVLDATANYDSFEWSDGSTGQTLDVTASGTYKVTVTQGSCSGEDEVTVTVSEVSDPVVDHAISYLVADTTAAGVFDKSLTQKDASAVSYDTDVTPKWYDADKNELASEPVPAVPADGGNETYTYYISVVNANGCESDLVEVTVTVSGAPTPTVSDIAYCLNDPTVSALEATATSGEDASESWTLRWYDADGNVLASAPTPDVTTAGETTYYVSQVSDVTGAESGRVPVKVSVYGVATPDVSANRLLYCEGETYETVSAVSQADASAYLMGDGTFVWSVDGTEVSEPTVSTQKESITYAVKETYTIAAGHVCESETAEFTVKTTFVPDVTGDLTVNYLMKDGESGTFPSLDTKNPAVATAADGYSLVWFDADKSNGSSTAPSPVKDPSWTAGEEQTLTYYVAQSDGTCSGDTAEIVVKISDSPMPKTAPVEYCQNATATALTATINDEMESADNYTLVWYDPTTDAELTSAPTPSTAAAGETTYYVAQRHNTTSATSAKSALKVTVHALPVLTTTVVPAQCGGSVILGNYITEADGQTVTQGFYSDAAATTSVAEIVTTSGTYYSNAYITLTNGDLCYSDIVSVEVEINDLSGLAIAGDVTVCPNGTVTLTASATSNDPGVVTYSWEGGVASTDGSYTTSSLTGAYGKQYTFTVKASAGACVETETATHTVTIDKGVLTGAMTINGISQKLYKTCGGESVEIATTHTGTDYTWTTLDGRSLSGTTGVTDTPAQTTTYVVSLTNVCATSDTVTVEVHPLAAMADWTKLGTTVCEGFAASASLTLSGYDATMEGSSIKWYKDGEELSEYADKTNLVIADTRESDSGTYSYKVSNGICEVPETADEGTLKVVAPATYTKSEGVVSCSGDAVEISVIVNEADAQVTWTDNMAAPATRTVTPSTDQIYSFTITRGDVCLTADQLTVSVKEKPAVTVEDVDVCEGSGATLHANVTGNDLTSYTWNDESGETLSTTVTLNTTPSESTTYTFTVTSESCGEATATAKANVVELPVLELDSISLRAREVVVTEGGYAPVYEYKMDKGDWQDESLFENLSYSLHTVYAKDEIGCVGSLMFEVTAPGVSVDEYFTPNGDGVNEVWDVASLMEVYPNAKIKIFDRFGKVVAELDSDVSEWDGTYNGNPLPSTDYWYTITIPEIAKTYNGHFTLVRK